LPDRHARDDLIDQVRSITNRSSGKMGYAIARAALNAGAKVTLVSGPVHLEPPYSGGTDMPSTPMSASVFMFSAGQVPSRYLIARGANSFWQTLRTVSTRARCYSLMLKSMKYFPCCAIER